VNTIAGHSFEPPDSPEARCACGRWWADICDATEADIGKPGLAHIGTLNTVEHGQIVAERTRRIERAYRVWSAVIGVSSR
jgi:hypothetical protein